MKHKVIPDPEKGTFLAVQYDPQDPLIYSILGTFSSKEEAENFIRSR